MAEIYSPPNTYGKRKVQGLKAKVFRANKTRSKTQNQVHNLLE